MSTPARAHSGSRARGRRSQKAILDAAIEVTAKGGLESASLGAVAEQAGASKALVAYHFGSVAQLKREMTARVGRRFAKLVLKSASESPGAIEERAVAVLDAVFHPDNRILFLAMHELLNVAPREPAVAEMVAEGLTVARKLLAAVVGGQEDPRALRAAGRAVAAVYGYISLWIASGAGDPGPWRDDAERVARILLAPVAPGPAEGRA